MNTNQKAIEFLEENEYEAALELFQKAATESRSVQSLNNLAWMYSHEEEDDEKALETIIEAVKMKPFHYFPYNILGEIYIRQKKWNLASDALQKSISIQPSQEAYNNLAVAKYYLGERKEASEFFLQAAGDSDMAMYSHVKCLIDLGNIPEAKRKLDLFHADADEFVGELDVADLYVEMECFQEAVYWFEKGWNEYWKDPSWIGRFVFALFKTKNMDRISQVIQEAIKQKDEEIKDAEADEIEENWSENDKREFIEKRHEERSKYENMIELISSEYKPLIEFEPAVTSACYIFGCERHNHPEYQE